MKKSYQEELFNKLVEHPNWKNEIDAFCKIIGQATWWFIPKINNKYVPSLNNSSCPQKSTKTCLSSITKLLLKTKKTLQGQKIVCSSSNYLYCLPIIRGDKIYGYVCICALKSHISPKILELFYNYTLTTVEGIQKELELFKLYETIRPRTIALSTIHTINRIISSTLEIKELLPRIARLSLQVLRARRCSIMLVDKYKRLLIPHALVDQKKDGKKQSILKIGKGLPGKVVKTGKTMMTPQYLCVPLVAEELIIGSISVSHRLDHKAFNIFDKEILTTLAEQAVIAIKNAQLYEEQENLTLGSIKALASILSSGAAYTYGRTNLFINVTMSIGMELKLSSEEMRTLYYAALLHNVSQMGLPEKILKKSTKLTGKEYNIVKEQHLKGAKIIKPIGGTLKSVLPIIIYHHERYDGRGYPSGLIGERIPLGARILAAADAFEAMLTKRPYREKKTISQALMEIVKFSGTQFDPKVVNAFGKVVKRSKNKIFQRGMNSWIWKKL